MTELELVLSVIGMFILRIGIPLILLVILGTMIDRWQRRSYIESNQHHDQIHG